jgi:hypothetical protein
MNDLIQQGVNAYKSGDRENARRLFIAAVKQFPDDEHSWGWLYNVCNTDQERIQCLKQVLRINPKNEKAGQLLNRLTANDFPLERPPFYVAIINELKRKKQIGLWLLFVGGAMLVVVIVIAILNNTNHLYGYAWNYPQTIEQGAVQIQVARIAIYSKSSLSDNDQKKYYQNTIFSDAPTICDVYFKITNNSDRVMSVFADQGLLLANDEQVQLFSYALYSSGTISGQILPGATVTGSIQFGLKKVTPDSINRMIITIKAPFDENYESYGGDYVFNLDLSQHKWVDKPAELK